uniref:Uncharacterized protein n=1 Tax=Siphoviridae sp. ctv0N24 TaxID=2826509 RepID=A0A8S5N307_9CAUD|nr:MAG TPA: hypothetical protein [Siphoviridae sp. ctv0N24]DAH31632.1 MAG TPA: hypothetical protein [Caudoviricetes sp.]
MLCRQSPVINSTIDDLRRFYMLVIKYTRITLKTVKTPNRSRYSYI